MGELVVFAQGIRIERSKKRSSNVESRAHCADGNIKFVSYLFIRQAIALSQRKDCSKVMILYGSHHLSDELGICHGISKVGIGVGKQIGIIGES